MIGGYELYSTWSLLVPTVSWARWFTITVSIQIWQKSCVLLPVGSWINVLSSWRNKLEYHFSPPYAFYFRDEEWAKEKRMGCFLSVGAGSEHSSRFLELHYKGSDCSPVVLVGKGVWKPCKVISTSMISKDYCVFRGWSFVNLYLKITEAIFINYLTLWLLN